MSAPSPSDPSPHFRPASEITLRPVEWLWPGHLALGEVALLEGDPDRGKSWVALDLCARLSTGRPWPDGAPAPPPAASIFLSGEDSDETTLGPRLRALGADLTRVFLPDCREAGPAAKLCLPSQTGALEQVVARTGARLVVIDPIMYFLGREVNPASDQGVRRALEPLGALARRYACAVQLVRHLNKAEGLRVLYRGLGSIAFVGACRSAWLVAEDAATPGRRVLAQLKNNLGPAQPSLAFEVAQPQGQDPTLNWLGPVAATAEELVRAAPARGRPPARRRSAVAFLNDLLSGGPMRVADIWQRVLKEGLSPNTVRDAGKDLRVRSRKVKEDGRQVNYWLLPGQCLPGEDKPEEEMDPLMRRFKELEELYPPRTPLEEDDF